MVNATTTNSKRRSCPVQVTGMSEQRARNSATSQSTTPAKLGEAPFVPEGSGPLLEKSQTGPATRP
jgi:hypothetical protein